MTHPDNLKFDKNSFDFEETNIYGIYESDRYMTWHIEMFPQGEDNYIMFNSVVLDNIFSPNQLSDVKYIATSGTGDLYEHTICVNGQDRFLQSIDMTFGKWDTETQSIKLTGYGNIDEDGDLPEIDYQFSATLSFKGLNLFETTKEETQTFVDKYLATSKDRLEIKFDKAPSGLQALIGGRF